MASRLAETIVRWLGRVEVVLAGVDGALRDGQEALANGEPMRARAEARIILERVPESPIGLALLADACEMAGLDAELALTLEELAGRVASRADIWVRLARARETTRAPTESVRDAYARAIAVAESGSEARREAMIALADLDLAEGDGARADLWLDRIAADNASDVALRRAEAALTRGDGAKALTWLASFESAPTDARGALARGLAFAKMGNAEAFLPLVRAMVLDAEGASEALSSAVAWIASDGTTRERVRAVVEAHGEIGHARWRAAFARAEGRRDEARGALRDAVRGGDFSAARPLLDAAIEDRDEDARREALATFNEDARTNDRVIADAARLPTRAEIASGANAAALLDALSLVTSDRLLPWAAELRDAIVRTWVPARTNEGSASTDWSALLARLDGHARALHDIEATAQIAAIAQELARPVRIAIVGEFNAGKSTFINALLGADVAPTGVLPTTATLHHLRYAPDPIARIVFERGEDEAATPPERIVGLSALRATLKATQSAHVRRVEILGPLPFLTRVEILDTPGFNAPDARHTEAARAAFEEADAVIWLLDAAQAMKQSERVILEETRAAKIPVQFLVNKADRLKEEDLGKVMELVRTSLREIGIASWSPPIALSARLALAGKLGDATALDASSWNQVQAMLDAEFIARSDELKERALRRRALHVVARLGSRAARVADEARSDGDAERTRREAITQAATTLDRDAEEAVKRIAEALATASEAWLRDVSLVVTGREANAVANDPVLFKYREERAVAHLSLPLAEALGAYVPRDPNVRLDRAGLARALVRGATSSLAESSLPFPRVALARAAVATLLEHLVALARVAPASRSDEGPARELASLAAALA